MLDNRNKQLSIYCRWLGIYMLFVILGAMSFGTLGSLLKIIGFIPVAIWLIQKHRFYTNRIIFFSILFVIWSSISFFWSINTSSSFSRAITQLSFLLMLMSVAGYYYRADEVIYLKKCMIWSSRLTAVIVMFTGTYAQSRLLLSGIISENPNYLCAYCLFALANATVNILSTQSELYQKIIAIIEIAVYIYITFATGSRGGLLSLVIASVFIVLFYKDSQEIKGISIIKKIGIILLAAGIYGVVISYMPSEIARRFTEDALINSNNGSGRYLLWEDSINAFRKSGITRKLIGYGAETSRNISYLFDFRIHNVIHNIFIEYLVEIGIVGLSLYVLHILCFVISSIRSKDIFCLSILFGMIVLSVSSSIYAFKPYWNIMILTLCMVRKSNQIDNEGH